MGERNRAAAMRLPTSTNWSPRRWAAWIASLLALLAVPVLWALLIRRRDGTCRNLEQAAAFGGSPAALRALAGRPADCGLANLDSFHSHVTLGIGYAIVVGAIVFLVCQLWWDSAWLSRRFVAAEPVKWLALVGAGCDVLVRLAVRVALRITGSGADRRIDITGWVAFVLPGLVWVKVFALATAWLAALFTLVAAFSRRRLDAQLNAPDPVAPGGPAGLGICCSGGGIRAASVSLGALGVLERHTVAARDQPGDGQPRTALVSAPATSGLLGRARYLASVSGGGYTAGGWRAASAAVPTPTLPDEERTFAALWPSGVVGDPDEYLSTPPPDADSRVGPGPPSLYRHLQQRREFLRTGRGGLPASLIAMIGFLLFHLLLWMLLVVVVAWPVGKLETTWFVVGARSTAPATFIRVTGRQLPFDARLYGPAVFFAAVAVVVFAACLVQWNTSRRRKLMGIGKGFVAGAVFLALLLVGIPFLLDVVYPFLTTNQLGQAISAISSAGGVLAIVIGLVKRAVVPRLLYLGGVLLAIAAVALGVIVAGQAALGRGFFALRWVHGVRGVPTWAFLCGLLVLAYFTLCPRWWSMHTVYRNRLRGAFVTSRDPATAPAALRRRPRVVTDDHGRDTAERELPNHRMWPVRQQHEPLLQSYVGATGPVHLVCCSMARTSTRATGVRALSFVVDPEHVTYYDVDYGRNQVKTTVYSAPTQQWVQALGRQQGQHAEGTVSAAISVSGAAIAPAMGRLDKGSTNSLLALLNLRLGAWWPNPRYVPPTGRVRYPWVRLSYMLKEITGSFDPGDHHVYVTDGGHRENLGLVELLRRRCRTMVCIDASGDTPGSFTTLRQAAELARLEVKAHIDLSSLPTPTDGAPEWAHALLPVAYFDDDGNHVGEALIVHIGSMMFTAAPDDLVAFALEDTRFPHYSTGNQFLTEEQFRRLVAFGAAATRGALGDDEARAAILDALADPPQPQRA